MSSTEDYAEFIRGQFEGLEGITVKRMFGGYCLHFQGKVLGFLFENQFLMEDGPTARRLMPDAVREPLFPGSKDFVIFPNVDNARYMQQIAVAVYDDLPIPKPRKSSRPKETSGAAKTTTKAGKTAKSTAKKGSSQKKDPNLPSEINDFLDFHHRSK